ncbi:MAG: NUDIX hydrolase [Anaerolineae bacterium]|jgi:8-oxo-dGTP pyrophosphatase MutT (NUDIX family)|nr:NUDIX hydrolase [Anaerolineae bacterium]MBT7190012.1 NUDIX hydrolase [Anaerolineae bacterium]
MEYINSLRKHVGNSPLIMVGSTVLVLNSQNKLLMMKRSDSNMWGVPGGAMELGETTEETARRELLEETGLTADGLTLFDVFSGEELYYRYPSGEEVYNISIVYITRGTQGDINLLDGEHYDFQYFELSKLPKDISPPIKPILRKLVDTNLKND